MNKHLIAVYAISLAYASLAHGQLVQNGSFELGTNPGSSFVNHPVNSPNLPGWTVFQSDVDIIGPSLMPAQDGQRHVDLHGSNGAGGIRQTIATVDQLPYLLTFWQSAQPYDDNDLNPRISTVRVSIDGVPQNFQFDTTGVIFSDPQWVQRTLPFTASGSDTEIEFLSVEQLGTSGRWYTRGPMLDNVAVVPEPSAVLFLVSGIAMFGMLRRRAVRL
ncbi:MAG: choice-of-anchor C family protein [Chthoniobacteraceae bacterium]